MRLYLDTGVYNRPFDEQTQPRIWLETLAFSVIMQLVEAGEVELVSSSVLEYENSQNPFVTRRRWVERCVGLAKVFQKVDETIRERAGQLEAEGIEALDALHVASAEAADSEYLLTCDDRLVRRYDGEMKVLNPVDFVRITGG